MALFKDHSSWLGKRFLKITFSAQEDDPEVNVQEIRQLLDEEAEKEQL